MMTWSRGNLNAKGKSPFLVESVTLTFECLNAEGCEVGCLVLIVVETEATRCQNLGQNGKVAQLTFFVLAYLGCVILPFLDFCEWFPPFDICHARSFQACTFILAFTLSLHLMPLLTFAALVLLACFFLLW
jgi:hypothetical protein